MRHLHRLFLNHLDAWGLALTIGLLALMLHDMYTVEALLLVLLVTAGYWYGFAVNDYWDAPYDACDPRKAGENFFVLAPVPRWFIIISGAGVALLATALMARFGPKGVFVCVLGIIILWAYSAPPLRIKSRPGFDLLTHMFFVETFPYGIILYLLELPWRAQDTALVILFLLGSLGAQLEQQARDYDFDRHHEANFTVRFGFRTTAALLRIVTALLILIVMIFFFGQTLPFVLAPFGLAFLPLLLDRFFRDLRAPRSERLTRLSFFIGLVYMGLLWGVSLLA